MNGDIFTPDANCQRISGGTDPHAAAHSAFARLTAGSPVTLLAVGPAAVSQAVKTASRLSDMLLALNCTVRWSITHVKMQTNDGAVLNGSSFFPHIYEMGHTLHTHSRNPVAANRPVGGGAPDQTSG